ncbi:Septum-promoting GTP-binding protein 1 [Glycine soja]|uniref:Septum-promoting GTP-binding protein 1 n=1 Tax=Glycine soja TaxID=3848 RepID=A0A445KG33_GLYSO|nr:Septum-promoting GTP-binding protein 1 [Glycine soja]
MRGKFQKTFFHKAHKEQSIYGFAIQIGNPYTDSQSTKYVGYEKDQRQGNQREGLNQMDKTLVVEGARISYCIWEVRGDGKSEDQLPMACMDSVAILIMFDLTSRCTLNSVVGWYKEARKWNQTAIPVLIGTKFDDFIQLPIDLQWTIANEVRIPIFNIKIIV